VKAEFLDEQQALKIDVSTKDPRLFSGFGGAAGGFDLRAARPVQLMVLAGRAILLMHGRREP